MSYGRDHDAPERRLAVERRQSLPRAEASLAPGFAGQACRATWQVLTQAKKMGKETISSAGRLYTTHTSTRPQGFDVDLLRIRQVRQARRRLQRRDARLAGSARFLRLPPASTKHRAVHRTGRPPGKAIASSTSSRPRLPRGRDLRRHGAAKVRKRNRSLCNQVVRQHLELRPCPVEGRGPSSVGGGGGRGSAVPTQGRPTGPSRTSSSRPASRSSQTIRKPCAGAARGDSPYLGVPPSISLALYILT